MKLTKLRGSRNSAERIALSRPELSSIAESERWKPKTVTGNNGDVAEIARMISLRQSEVKLINSRDEQMPRAEPSRLPRPSSSVAHVTDEMKIIGSECERGDWRLNVN